MADIILTILGSSSGMPCADRINSGYLLEIENRLILFDCGGGVSHSFKRAGFDPLAVDSIVISHTHPDHISDLPLFVQMLYLSGKGRGEARQTIRVYLPREAVKPITEYFRALYLMPEKLPFDVDFIPVVKDRSFDENGVTVLPILNNHLIGYKRIIEENDLDNRMECYSYLIKIGDKSILYTADLGSEKDITRHLKNLDLLVVESTHIDVALLPEAAAENNVRKIVLTHFNDDFDIPAAEALADKMGISNLIMAYDGLRIEV